MAYNIWVLAMCVEGVSGVMGPASLYLAVFLMLFSLIHLHVLSSCKLGTHLPWILSDVPYLHVPYMPLLNISQFDLRLFSMPSLRRNVLSPGPGCGRKLDPVCGCVWSQRQDCLVGGWNTYAGAVSFIFCIIREILLWLR